MKAVFLPPRDSYLGNLVWKKEDFDDKQLAIEESLQKLRKIGYWASVFPEGDGIAFKFEDELTERNNEEMFNDFKSCFEWIIINKAESKNSNTELAKLEDSRKIQCIIIVPLLKVYIQNSLTAGPYKFFCRREFDPDPSERLVDFESEYLQFETELVYKDLLRVNETFSHNDYVLNKCLSLAEHALDLVRYVHSSFRIRDFTPDPAGQLDDGFFAVDIIPLGKTHINPIQLRGISRPLSIRNNWLGPQIDRLYAEGMDYLTAVYNGDIENEMSTSIVSALRSCRQSFYSLGYESQFLNLVFTLDGLTEPDGNGWKQRTYIAALLSKGDLSRFEKILIRYDELYFEVRNKIVHQGLDFYQLNEDPNVACEEMYGYIKEIIKLTSRELFSNLQDMKAYAIGLLQTQQYKEKYTAIINSVSSSRGKSPNIPSW